MRSRSMAAAVCGVLVLSSVTVATPASGGSHVLRMSPYRHARAPRVLRHVGLRAPLTVSAPPGCISQGGDSFLGITRASDDDVALGHATGVASGGSNESCDDYTAILGGYGNVIGGYMPNSAEHSGIGIGVSNTIDASLDGFIGGGTVNNIGRISGSGYDASDSAIVDGESNTIGAPYSFIGAGFGNSVAGTTVATNGQAAFIGAGQQNLVTGNFSSVVGGSGNSNTSDASSIVGGTGNQIQAGTASGAFIGGGLDNLLGGGTNVFVGGGTDNNAIAGDATFIGGGSENTLLGNESVVVGGNRNASDAPLAFIGGGSSNEINPGGAGGTTANASAIGGGANNLVTSAVSGGSQFAVIGGGRLNHVAATAGTIGGGYSNLVGGAEGTVPGGTRNVALGTDSFAAGTASRAAHVGTFVWSDDVASPTQLVSTASNQFLARASGGYFLYSSATLKSGVRLAPGSGSWSNLSDRNVKTGIVRIDEASVLAKLDALPLSEWSYTAQGTAIRHIGPMAQDFYASFRVGEDDKHIATVDEDGVALAAIKALSAQVRSQRVELARKDRELVALQRRVAQIASVVASLASRHGSAR